MKSQIIEVWKDAPRMFCVIIREVTKPFGSVVYECDTKEKAMQYAKQIADNRRIVSLSY